MLKSLFLLWDFNPSKKKFARAKSLEDSHENLSSKRNFPTENNSIKSAQLENLLYEAEDGISDFARYLYRIDDRNHDI